MKKTSASGSRASRGGEFKEYPTGVPGGGEAASAARSSEQAHEDLRAAQERLRLALQVTGAGMWEVDLRNGRIAIDPETILALGYSRDEVPTTAEAWDALRHPEDRPRAAAAFQALLRGETDLYRVEQRTLGKDGTWYWSDSRGCVAERTADGVPVRVIGTHISINERKQAEATLQESEAKYRTLFETAHDAILLMNEQVFLACNPRALEIFGCATADLIGRSPAELSPPCQPDGLPSTEKARNLIALALQGHPQTFEWRHRRLDGTVFDAEASLNRVELAGRVCLQAIVRDVTERKRVENAIQASEGRARLQREAIAELVLDESIGAGEMPAAFHQVTLRLAETMGAERASIWLLSDDGTELRCLSLFEVSQGRHTAGTVLKTADIPAYFEAIRSANRVTVSDALSDPRTVAIAPGYLAPLGITSLLDAGIQSGGRLAGVVCVEHVGPARSWQPDEEAFVSTAAALVAQVLSHSERVRAEDAFRESESRYGILVNTMKDVLYSLTTDGKVEFVGPQVQAYGYSEAEMMGKDFLPFIYAEDQPAVLRDFQHTATTGEETLSTFRFLDRNGRLRWFEEIGRAVRDRAGNIVAVSGIMRDITERKQAEERIRQQAALLDASHDAVLVWNVESGIQLMNPAAQELTGVTAEEARSRPLPAVLRPRSEVALEAAIQEVTSTGNWSGELTLLAADDKACVVASRWTLLPSEEGKSAAVLIICNDITEKKQLEQQYLRAQRLESVGTLASGVAHDLNNILSPLVMGVELLGMQSPDQETRGILNMMKQSARRGIDTVKQLLTFARGAEAQKGPVQPRHLLEEIVRLLQQTFPKNIQIYSDYAEQLATVLADPSQLHQVLMNLCVNARDAMPEGGVLFLRLENCTLDDAGAKVHPKARSQSYVVFKVRDSGTGIPPEILDRVFDPFFTTKSQGKGTGLGLATVLGIVEDHGGFVLVESKLGQGTTFQVFLPASAALEEMDVGVDATAPPRGHGQVVLVVDDEPAILHLASEILRRGGYQTTTASNASEAIYLYERNRDRIRAVLTDIMMPFGDGRQLITALYAEDPELPIIAMSGLATKEFQGETLKRGARAFIHKPFAAEQLLTLVADLIPSK